MGNAADELLSHMPERTGYDLSYEEVRGLQIAAMNERLQEQVGRIKLIAMRAKDAGISEIRSLEDVVPLLLPHTAYKSYPESFLMEQKWDRLTKWLSTVSAYPTSNTNLEGINGIDEWIERLQQAGHYVSCSSGTTGKSAMLIVSEKDIEFGKEELVNAVCWGAGLEPDQSHRLFGTGPVAYVPKNTSLGIGLAMAFSRQDVEFFRSPAPPMTVGSITNAIITRKKIAEGSALPSEIAEFEATASSRQQAMTNATRATVEAMIAARGDKVFIMGLWDSHYTVAAEIRKRGYSAKDFHPDNAIFVTGGLKRAQLPDNYREFVYETFNISPERTFLSYGMQELATNMPRCRKGGRYHVPAWLVCLPLNENGDKLLPLDNGRVQGRAAFFDLAMDGRWGGIISGDRIEVDFSPCTCGAKSPSITDNITRYADLGGDDKIGCSGTVDAYVRGLS
jgi:hypothetical protein